MAFCSLFDSIWRSCPVCADEKCQGWYTIAAFNSNITCFFPPSVGSEGSWVPGHFKLKTKSSCSCLPSSAPSTAEKRFALRVTESLWWLHCSTPHMNFYFLKGSFARKFLYLQLPAVTTASFSHIFWFPNVIMTRLFPIYQSFSCSALVCITIQASSTHLINLTTLNLFIYGFYFKALCFRSWLFVFQNQSCKLKLSYLLWAQISFSITMLCLCL